MNKRKGLTYPYPGRDVYDVTKDVEEPETILGCIRVDGEYYEVTEIEEIKP